MIRTRRLPLGFSIRPPALSVAFRGYIPGAAEAGRTGEGGPDNVGASEIFSGIIQQRGLAISVAMAVCGVPGRASVSFEAEKRGLGLRIARLRQRTSRNERGAAQQRKGL